MEERYIPVIPVENGLPSGIFKKEDVAKAVCGGLPEPLTKCVGNSFLLVTGAKGYYHGGGWWSFFGYAADKSDIRQVAEMLGFII